MALRKALVAILGRLSEFVAGDTLELNGSMQLTGNGRRITGEMTTTTVVDRVAFQTTVANSGTSVSVIPSGTSPNSSFHAYGAAAMTNCNVAKMRVIDAVEMGLRADIEGTASYVPMNFYTSSIVRLSIGVAGETTLSGDLVMNGAARRITGDMTNATLADRLFFQNSQANQASLILVIPNGTGNASVVRVYDASDPNNASFGNIQVNTSEVGLVSGANGTGTQKPLTFYTNSTLRMSIGTSGVFDVATNSFSLNPANSSAVLLEIGGNETGDRSCYADFHGNTTYTDYSLRVGRDNGGANGGSKIEHRGTGTLLFNTVDAGAMAFATTNTVRATLAAGGLFTLGYGLAVGGATSVFTKSVSVTPATLTSGTNISTDASNSNVFRLTLAHNATLDNPTNLADGMVLNFMVKQDGTGSRTLAYGSKFKWPGGTAPTLSTAANAEDMISALYDGTNDILLCNALKAFA